MMLSDLELCKVQNGFLVNKDLWWAAVIVLPACAYIFCQAVLRVWRVTLVDRTGRQPGDRHAIYLAAASSSPRLKGEN